jgi:hypothetical protein
VGTQGPVDHDRDLLGAVRRPFDRRQLGRMARITDGDAAEALDAFGEQVDQLVLLVRVFVEEQVEHIERRSGDQPVVLLVHAVEHHRVGQDLVEEPAALRTSPGRQADRQIAQRPEPLDLRGAQAQARLGRPSRSAAPVPAHGGGAAAGCHRPSCG